MYKSVIEYICTVEKYVMVIEREVFGKNDCV